MKTAYAFATLTSLLLLAQLPALAADDAAETRIEVRTFTADEAASVNLDSLKTADSLDREAMTGASAPDVDRGAVEKMFRRPIVVVRPPVVIVPPVYGRYYTCFARSRQGALYEATGFGSAATIQNRAMNSCYAYSPRCVPEGCR